MGEAAQSKGWGDPECVQTASVGSKVLCYLLGTIYVPLQLDPCCINKKSVKEVFCCTTNEHDAARIRMWDLCAYFHGRSKCCPACRRKRTPDPARPCVHALVSRVSRSTTEGGRPRCGPIAR